MAKFFDHQLYGNLFARIERATTGDAESKKQFAEKYTLETILLMQDDNFPEEWVQIIRETPLERSLSSVDIHLGRDLPQLIGKAERVVFNKGTQTALASLAEECNH